MVLRAPDAHAALELLGVHRPPVAILDIGLPGMNGYELARRLRALPGCADATLVAITGYGQQADQASAAYAGFDSYFVKPVDPAGLFALLDRVAAR